MEHIKALNILFAPDPRSSILEMVDRQTGARRNITLEDYHKRFSGVHINDSVPKDVQNGIIMATNLYIYSWFVYSFGPIAELQCLATLELALRHRNGTANITKGPRLHGLLSRAVVAGWLFDAGLPPEPPSPQPPAGWEDQDKPQPSAEQLLDPQRRVKHLAKSLPDWRNIIAHGAFMLFPPGNYMLMLVAAMINQLWPELNADAERKPCNPSP